MATQTPDEIQGRVPRPRTHDLLSALADRLGARFTAATVFGSPVERDGVTVIPVAMSRFAVGGGGGSDPSRGEGDGGGGAGAASPVGYIELRGDRTRFVPIVHPARMAMILAGAALAVAAIARASRPPARAGRRR